MDRFFEIAARLQAAGAGEALAMIVLKATLILLIARLLLAALPRAAAATRHAIAAVALCSTVALLLLTPILPAWNVAVFEAPPEAAISGAPVPAIDPFAGAESGRQPAATVTKAEPVTPIRAITAVQSVIRLTASTWKGAAVLILLGGALAFIIQMIAGMAGVWLVSRSAVELEDDATLLAFDEACDQLALRRDVRLLRSPRITVPVVWGVIRPMLLLPADCVAWPAERMRVVLLHELAHLKRIDGITLLMTRLAVSLYWFHPLAWSLERAGRGACEQACDDIVLASGTKPSDYADHLLHLAKALPSFDPFRSVTLAMSRRSQLEGRLVAILQTRVQRGTFTARGVAIAIVLAALIVFPITAVRLIAQPSEKKKELKADSVIDVTPELDKLSGMFSGDDDDEEKYKKEDKHGNDLSTGHGWYEYAGELYSKERYQDAIAAYQEAIKRGHDVEDATYNIACSYALMDDKDHALEWLQKAIGAGFDNLDHIAEDDDLDPIRSDPRFARIVNDPEGRAQIRIEHVLQRYRELKQQGTDNPDDWCSNGMELLELRRLDEAIDAFQQSAKYPDNRPEALYKLGMAYSMKGDGERAVDAIREAIERGGGNDKFKGPEFAALRRSPRFAELQRFSKDMQMVGCCDKGASYKPWVMQSYEDAYQHHKAIAARYPNQPRAIFNLGFMALRADHFQEGIDAFQRCVSMNYRVGTSSYNVGCGYALAGNAGAALQWLERSRAAGFQLHGYIDDDDDLDNIRGDQRFKALRRAVKSENEKEHSE